MQMSDTPAAEPKPPPALGAHGREILREHGYDEAAIDRLFDDGVLTTRERRIERDEAAAAGKKV